MPGKLISRVRRLPTWQLWVSFALTAIFCVELIVSFMSWLLVGSVTRDYLITGLVAAAIVAPATLALLSAMLKAESARREMQLQADAKVAEEGLNMTIEVAKMMFWEYDVSTDRLLYEDAKIAGLGVATTQAHHSVAGWLDHVHPDDRENFLAQYMQCVKPGGTDLDIEYRFAAREAGQWVWLQTRGRIVKRDASGVALWAVGGSVNVSERRLAAIALTETRDRLQNIFNDNPDVMVLSRLEDGKITEVNAAFLRTTGYTLAEVIGKSTVELGIWVNPEDHQKMMRLMQSKGYCSSQEAEFQSRKGDRAVGSISGVVTHFAGVPHILNTVRDVTRRRQAEDKLRQSETLLRSTLEATDEGILMIAHDGRVLSANKRFIEMWRVPPELAALGNDSQLLAHVIDQLVDPASFMGEVQRLYNSDEAARDTLIFKDGRVFARFSQALTVGESRGRIWCFRDVTEQVLAQAKLAEREEIYRAIVTQASDGIVMVDLATQRFVEFNEAACNALGYTREEFSTMAIANIQAVHSPEKIASTLNAIQTNGRSDFETMHRHKNGSLRNVRVSNRLINLRGKDFIAAIITDITEKIQITQTLEDRHLFLKTLLNAVPIPLFYKDLDGRYLGCNASFESFNGREAAQIVGKTVFDLSPSHLAQIYHEQDLALMGSAGVQVYDAQVKDASGRMHDVVFHKAAFCDTDGKVRGLIGAVIDVTEQKLAVQALGESEQRARELATLLRLMCDNVPDMIWAKGLDRRYLFANKAICDQLLMADDTDEPVGRDDMFFAERQRTRHADVPNWHTFGELCQDSDAVTLKKGRASQFDEFGNVRGEFMFLDVHKAPFVNEKGEVIGVVGSARNVTQQRLADEKLRLASLVLENSSEAMMITDETERIVDVNPAFTKLTGYTLQEVIGENPALLHSGRQSPDFYRGMWREIEATGRWQGEIWNQRKNGEVYAEWLTINTFFHDDGSVRRRVALFSDITERKKAEELIWSQANFDVLTQLPNRRMFRDRLAQDLRKATRANQKLALLFLDLDRFKEVNDTLGHQKGDILLVEAARRIAACVRASDTVARLGGDEFTIILTELEDPVVAERIAENIIQVLRQPIQLGTDVAHVSASLGITLFPDDSIDLDELIKHADRAMYVAKSGGRNRFSYFTRAMQDAAQHRIALLQDLRGAMEGQQFLLHYQPIVALETGRINKVEALLRWVHPVRGTISPAQFIPLAEESGLIHEIGDWVFMAAARQAKVWRAAYGADFQVSVNVSPIQMQAAKPSTRWLDEIRALGLDGFNLVIEITEGLLLESSEQVTARLLAFRDAGVQVAIDDFGTGYSALSYLKKLDIDYIKIDQSFIRNLATDASDMALSEAMVVMAHKLGLKVIAEGVETAQQRDLLAGMGCDFAQGYLYFRPVSASEMDAILRGSRD